MSERVRYFLITGSDEICEVVDQSALLKAVHDMFCCGKDLESCDNPYFEAFKEKFRDGVDFEGWKESLEDGWLNVEELPAQPKQMARLSALQQSNRLELAGRIYGLQEAAVIAGETSIGLAIYERIKFLEANCQPHPESALQQSHVWQQNTGNNLPKPHDEIQIYSLGDGVEAGYMQMDSYARWFTVRTDSYDEHIERWPTHWKPLDNPPSAAIAEATSEGER